MMISMELQPLASVKLSRGIKAREDISAIAKMGPFLVIGSDEGVGPDKNENVVQVLNQVGDNHYEVQQPDILLFKGFLILTGPVGDGPGSYQLYHWDGKDILPGSDHVGQVSLLCEIRPPREGKAEGIVVLEETDTWYDLIIVYGCVNDI
jgi:hypothetical protein